MPPRKKEEVKPLFPLKHEFYASLDRFIHEAGMLADAARQLLDIPGLLTNEGARGILRERLDAFSKARFGEPE